MNPQRQKRDAPFQVFLTPEERHQLRLKVLQDRESMQVAVSRLIGLYLAGRLPEAEPERANP